MNYWIFVTNDENWQIICKNKIWGVSESKKKILEKIKIGDKIVFYIKGGIMRGIFEVQSAIYIGKDKIFKHYPEWKKNEIFPYRINIQQITKDICEVKIKNILDNLSFIVIKKNWAPYFYRTIINIPYSDYQVIRKKMKYECG